MTPERFCALVDACGADFNRWPEAEREAGRALAATGSRELDERLKAAALIDGWLDSHVVAEPDAALVARIAARATGASGASADETPAGTARNPPTPRARQWPLWLWPGIGFAGIGIAGTLAGALGVSAILQLVPASAPTATMDFPERVTAFSELPADWSEE